MALSSQRIPSLLASYLKVPPQYSLTLVTAVLNATSNWLLLRFIYTTLASTRPVHIGNDDNIQGQNDTASVVFVSFLRDWAFWRDSAKRLQCDLARLSKEGRFVFVDGLSDLFGTTGNIPASKANSDGQVVLRDSSVKAVQVAISAAIENVQSKVPGQKVLLIVDGLDFLLAATGQDSGVVDDAVSSWREIAHAVIVTSSADSPLLHSSSTPLETDHAAFTVGLAHQARAVISLRLLSTGVAKDVSGELRITKGPAAGDDDGREVEEKELLYFVSGDGSVQVFERGSR